MPSAPCSACGATNTGRSPTGDWCNYCGAAWPGLWCEACERSGVNERHKRRRGDFWADCANRATLPEHASEADKNEARARWGDQP